MKKFQLFIITIFISTMCMSQESDAAAAMMKSGEDALAKYQIEKAISIYSEVVEANPQNVEAKEKLAAIYAAPGPKQDINKSVSLYGEAFSSGFMSPNSIVKYANLLQGQNNYDKARSVYNFYSNKGYSMNSLIKSVNPGYFSSISEPNRGVILTNVGDVNTPNSDFSPAYYRDGLSYVSTRKNRSKTGFKSGDEIISNFTDIFKSKSTDKASLGFDNSELLLKASNQKYMQGPMTFSEDYGVMYITRSTTKEGKSFAMEDGKTVLMEICRVNYSDGDVEKWDDIKPVVLNRSEGYQNYSYAHPAFVTPNGDEMIFASNMPGGMGGTDLWYSRLVGSEWSTPSNLGPEINTAGDEMFPFVSKDGSLYYASNGLPGLGGLDIYKAAKLNNGYGQIENLGAPFNSKYDDFAYITDETGREGYLSSNRVGGKGLDDIYFWRTNETKVCVKVIESVTKDPIRNATVKIPCLGTKSYNTNENGIVCVTVTSLKNCDIKAAADGFQSNSLKANNIQSNKLIEIPLDRDYVDRCKFVVRILDKESGLPIPGATVNIRQTTTNEEVEGPTRDDGTIRVKGISMNEFYEINATKTLPDGSRYIGIPESAICKGLKNGDSITKTIYLRKAIAGSKFEIENIYYDVNKWDIRPDAARELDKIVQLLRQYPTMEIEMGSHTDCRATKRYNENLSSKRAAACVEYLANHGISASRLSSKGYGESQLKVNCPCEGRIKSNCSENEHQQNRRTEFKIVKF